MELTNLEAVKNEDNTIHSNLFEGVSYLMSFLVYTLLLIH